jgi:hypothetical protein
MLPPPERIPVSKILTKIRFPITITHCKIGKPSTVIKTYMRFIRKDKYYTKIGPIIVTEFIVTSQDPNFPEECRHINSVKTEFSLIKVANAKDAIQQLKNQNFPLRFEHPINDFVKRYSSR